MDYSARFDELEMIEKQGSGRIEEKQGLTA